MKKIITILILSLLLFGGLIFHSMRINKTVSVPCSIESDRTGAKYFREPRPLGGKEISLEEAKSTVPFKIGILKLEKFGKLAFAKFTNENNVLYLVYSSKEIDPTYTSEDIMNSGAIVIVEYPNPSIEEGELRMDAIMETLKELKRNGKLVPDCPLPEKININGCSGIFGGNVGHSVTWFTKATWYEIYANTDIPYSDLIEIAESIKEQ